MGSGGKARSQTMTFTRTTCACADMMESKYQSLRNTLIHDTEVR